LEKVRADKVREVTEGHDGTWVAHPALVPLAREVFDRHMPDQNQIARKREDVRVSADDLVRPTSGTRTEAGLRHNIRVAVQYIEAWLRGNGCVPLYNLMEDAATAEISRAQVWQWLHHCVSVERHDGRALVLTPEVLAPIVKEEMDRIRAEIGEERFGRGRFSQARALFEDLCAGAAFQEFLTLPGYEQLIEQES
jgi:malate synthase